MPRTRCEGCAAPQTQGFLSLDNVVLAGHSYGGWIALGGLACSSVAAMVKFLKETSATDRFDTCHYQIDILLEGWVAPVLDGGRPTPRR